MAIRFQRSWMRSAGWSKSCRAARFVLYFCWMRTATSFGMARGPTFQRLYQSHRRQRHRPEDRAMRPSRLPQRDNSRVDVAQDPLSGEFRDLALAHGLRACWSTPILSSEGECSAHLRFIPANRAALFPNIKGSRSKSRIWPRWLSNKKKSEKALRASEHLARGQVNPHPDVGRPGHGIRP